MRIGMHRFGWLGLACALGLLGACGDDDGDTGGVDMAMTPDLGPCATQPPRPDELTEPCDYRVSNADRLDNPEFRVTNLQISEPAGTALTSGAVLNILAQAVEEERFNWLMQASITGTDVTVVTGYGEWDCETSTYAFVDGAAPPEGGDPDRWNPITITGTLDGNTFSAPPVAGSFAVPVFDESGENLDLELPLNSFEVINATFSEDRSCIGERVDDGSGFMNFMTGGEVRTFITVADAEVSIVTQLAGTSLCNLISGADCETDATADWRNTPNALCDADGNCSAGCDFAATGDCNAWEIRGSFAAAGVQIAD